MTSKDSAEDQELLDRYRRASDTDAAAPSDAVRSAILAESRRVAEQLAAEQLAAEQLAAKESPPAFDTSRPAANDSRWKITAFGTAGAALLAALLIAPRYWENLPTAQVSSPTAAPAAKLESIAPAQRAEQSQEMSALQENAARLDKKNSRLAQNYSPAPSADSAQNIIAGFPNTARSGRAAQGGGLMGADRAAGAAGAASAARERDALEPAGLQSAAAAGDLAQTALLLDQGAAVNTRDALGRTPLLLAVAQNRLEVVRLLLARGADPDAADNAGVTPLQLAKDKDLRDVAALLERAGTR